MKILKFGGTSVGSADAIKKVISIIDNYYSKRENISVVFSAFGGVTDKLIDLSNQALNREDTYLASFQNLRLRHLDVFAELVTHRSKAKVQAQIEKLFEELVDILRGLYLLRELTPRILDSIVSYGERLSAFIICESLKSKNIDCEFLDTTKIIKTNSVFGNAHINVEITNKNIVDYFKKHKQMQIITGFIASDENNEITTLGRGGSDFTASIFGAALKVSEIEIWTDVNGILTADPRKVNDALPLKAVTYQEAMEMSYFGAKVIYPPTMQPAFDNNVKIRIRNTFEPEFKGTIILKRQPEIKFSAKGISSVDNITLLRISGSGLFGNEDITSRIFDTLSEQKIKTFLLTQGSSGLSICIAVLPKDGKRAAEAIKQSLRLEIFDGQIREIEAEENLSIIAVVGEDMRHTPGISGKVFNALGKNGINIIAIAQGSSELNISFVIKNAELSKALNVLHDSLFLAERKIYNIFLVGIGLVGKALIQYIIDKKKFLANEKSIEFKLVGIANSKKMLIDLKGIDIENWVNELNNSKQKSDISAYITEMKKLNLANSIFVDCTATEVAVPFYQTILESNISITTPNKIANTKEYKIYKSLKDTANKKNVKFLYSTNVGAGLPIISTIRDLVNSGEKIIKIEGILSGTLSYLFNSFTGNEKFSEIVLTAKGNGYTEPDPRDDLNGLDVARKLLILIREIGEELELSDIEVENLVPEKARKSKTIDGFFKILKSTDKDFEERKISAEKNNSVLRYIAKYENKKATVKLVEVNQSHPFYNLKGNDNIVAITTKNYSTQPLIIRGRGAGAEFTASGIFADILRIINYLG
ncbi:MAG: bifunctional aspartate kinase/homoserine dehydrogenase I [Ignavibacteriales bacterium]|nr:bifunctional aspartate kinase/homoserine dehydrogenase I [Ignavibacteriales bacterium]MCB9219180.1 bifunctional aspartate kinase/homoserine dehydrogenase I [Ignavibacteriales bacterium]